jgi:hypothetical protein
LKPGGETFNPSYCLVIFEEFSRLKNTGLPLIWSWYNIYKRKQYIVDDIIIGKRLSPL